MLQEQKQLTATVQDSHEKNAEFGNARAANLQAVRCISVVIKPLNNQVNGAK